MSEIRFNINRANYGSHTYMPRLDTIESMKAAIRNNMAIARLEHPKDLPLNMQTARNIFISEIFPVPVWGVCIFLLVEPVK